jgi:hypothetical protein
MLRRTLAAAAVLATSLAFAGPGLGQTMVKKVDVSIDLPAITNPKAAAFWSRVAEDLENASVARVADRADPERGAEISVDIDELSLASSFEAAMNLADSRLAGKVNITSETDNSDYKAFDLAITLDQASLFMPEGTDVAALTVDSPVYYTALVNAFADGVVRNLD